MLSSDSVPSNRLSPWQQPRKHLRALWRVEALDVPPFAGLYEHLYLHPFPPSLGPTPSFATIRAMRPMGFDGIDNGDPQAWFVASGGRAPRLAYVTFGTEMAAIAPIGTVSEAFTDLNVDVVVTVGRDLDPESIVPRPANVRIERYVPQRLMMARASLLVSHAGSGAVFGAAACGVPQLCLPMGADQFDNVDVIAEAGCGLSLDPHEVGVDSVAASIRRVVEDQSIRDACRVVADESRPCRNRLRMFPRSRRSPARRSTTARGVRQTGWSMLSERNAQTRTADGGSFDG